MCENPLITVQWQSISINPNFAGEEIKTTIGNLVLPPILFIYQQCYEKIELKNHDVCGISSTLYGGHFCTLG